MIIVIMASSLSSSIYFVTGFPPSCSRWRSTNVKDLHRFASRSETLVDGRMPDSNPGSRRLQVPGVLVAMHDHAHLRGNSIRDTRITGRTAANTWDVKTNVCCFSHFLCCIRYITTWNIKDSRFPRTSHEFGLEPRVWPNNFPVKLDLSYIIKPIIRQRRINLGSILFCHRRARGLE